MTNPAEGLASRPLLGRTALVTGASMGIGRGIAVELARQGADVVVHYYAADGVPDDAVAEISQFGTTVATVEADLRDVEACRRVVAEAVQAIGGLDILVNNAGVGTTERFSDFTQRAYDDLFALNMRAYFFLAQAVAPHLSRGGRGAIVNIASIHAHAGLPGYTAYAATKGAINAFTRVAAIELAPEGIRVNAVAPGIVELPRYFDIPGYTHEFGCSVVPIGRVGAPSDIGTTVAFIVSDAASYITGQTLYVDGGTTAQMGMVWNLDDRAATARNS